MIAFLVLLASLKLLLAGVPYFPLSLTRLTLRVTIAIPSPAAPYDRATASGEICSLNRASLAKGRWVAREGKPVGFVPVSLKPRAAFSW